MKRIWLLWLVLVTPLVQAALPIQSWTMDNGARVLLVENHAIPMIDVRVEFDAGGRHDPKEKMGLASLTNGMLAHGIASAQSEPALTEAQISNAFADTAAQRDGGAGDDSAYVSLRMLSAQPECAKPIELLARLLAQPAFPKDLLARDKARVIASIKESETRPAVIGAKVLWKVMYGKHPYAYSPTAKSVAAIGRQDLMAFHRKHYLASNAVITIVGDVDKKAAVGIANELTRRLPAARRDEKMALLAVPKPKQSETRIAHPASQAHILLGMPAIKRGDSDYFALSVGNYILGGGGFVSRLMQEVREKRGLSYSISSSIQPKLQRGPVIISLQTKKQNADEALQIVRKVLGDFLRDGPSSKELQLAKNNLIGGFAMQIDSNAKILNHVAMIGYYRLPLDYLDSWIGNVEKVTADDVRAAFQRKLTLNGMTTVMVAAPE